MIENRNEENFQCLKIRPVSSFSTSLFSWWIVGKVLTSRNKLLQKPVNVTKMVKSFQIFLPIIFLVVSSASQGIWEHRIHTESCSGSLRVLQNGKTINSHENTLHKIKGGYPKYSTIVAEGSCCWRVFARYNFGGESTKAKVCSWTGPKKVSFKIRSICNNRDDCHKGFHLHHVKAGSSWVILLVLGVVMVSALAVLGFKRLNSGRRHQEEQETSLQEEQEMVEVNLNNDPSSLWRGDI